MLIRIGKYFDFDDAQECRLEFYVVLKNNFFTESIFSIINIYFDLSDLKLPEHLVLLQL